jgi:glyoxylase-like metal-dependent hydrolase (beta-lactamase superfamily II)
MIKANSILLINITHGNDQNQNKNQTLIHTMKIKISLLFLTSALSITSVAQNYQKGPYTLSTITKDVYHIEDGNNANPPGVHLNDRGEMTGMNNCSDMYLIVGQEKALLIDLSNEVKWDKTAKESLRELVREKTTGKKLFITVTHKHGDHLGMLPAFKNDADVTFWIPDAEFKGMSLFPEERTIYFKENEPISLGGTYLVQTLEVPGHTRHSTIFFLKGQNLVFTGDAIGSGSGVWLFDYDSFVTYKRSIDKLISYIDNPDNGVNTEKLVVFGGHYWQRGKLEKLTSQYIYDMKTLMEKIGQGEAESESTQSGIRFLDTNFRYGTATITWNLMAAKQYEESLKAQNE